MYRRILYAHDGSPSAARAIPHGAALAAAARAEIVLLQVIRPVGQQLTHLAPQSGWLAVPPAAVGSLQDMVAYERADALRQLHGAAQQLRALGVGSVRVLVVEGSPAEAIVAVGQREGCDLILIATRAQSGLRRALNSSVAEAVVAQSPRPVLLVGPAARGVSAALDTAVARMPFPAEPT